MSPALAGEFFTTSTTWDTLCGSAGKESPWNAEDLDSIPGLGRSPGEGKGYPLPYSGLENSMDCIVHGVTKSQTRLRNFHSLTHSFTPPGSGGPNWWFGKSAQILKCSLGILKNADHPPHVRPRGLFGIFGLFRIQIDQIAHTCSSLVWTGILPCPSGMT